MTDRQIEFHSKFGTLYICANENGLSYLGWQEQEYDGPHYEDDERIVKYLNTAHDQLEEYFAGSRKKFSIPLSISKGTDFQKQVWAQLLDIPYGEVTTYADIAKRVGSPKAVQAVGSANAKNPINLIIPCHRVIAKSGELSGYAGGADIKEALLNFEGGTRTLF